MTLQEVVKTGIVYTIDTSAKLDGDRDPKFSAAKILTRRESLRDLGKILHGETFHFPICFKQKRDIRLAKMDCFTCHVLVLNLVFNPGVQILIPQKMKYQQLEISCLADSKFDTVCPFFLSRCMFI